MNKKKKSKAPILTIIVSLALGILWGMFSVEYALRSNSQLLDSHFILMYLFFIFLIYFSIFLHTVIHEAGHLVFGMLTGYKPVSFRIGNLIWLKINGKLCLKKYSLAGTAGQCLMSPPDIKDGKFPYVLYNLGGSFLNLIFSIIFTVIGIIFKDNFFVSFIFFNLAIAGMFLGLTNGIPMHTGTVDNDGMNAWSLGKNPKALRAMWIQLKNNQLTAEGIRVKDMPDEWFALPDPEDMDNSLIASLGYFSYNRFLDEEEFDRAYDLCRLYISTDNAMPGIYKSLLTCELIYLELILQRKEVNINALYDQKLKKFINAMKKYPSVMRMEYTYALLEKRDIAEAEKIKQRFEKTAKNYPYSVEIQSEIELMEIAEESFKKMNT